LGTPVNRHSIVFPNSLAILNWIEAPNFFSPRSMAEVRLGDGAARAGG
jgi:hypothetical protein